MPARHLHAWTAAGLAVFAGGAMAVVAAAQSPIRDQRTTSLRFQFTGAGVRTLDVRAVNGQVRVIGDGGPDVRVEATTTIEAETAEALRVAQREVAIDGREQGDTVLVAVREGTLAPCGEAGNREPPARSAWWDRRRYHASVSLVVRAPRAVRVRVCTVNGGEASVDGTLGDFDVTNVNGRVALTGMRGAGRASTVNGNVEVAFDAAPTSESLFKTVNGDVTVTLPRGLAADLQIKTMRGRVYTDFDTTAIPVTREPARRSGEPRFVYRSRGFDGFRVGAGGPELRFETLNGDVQIRRGPG